MKFEINNFPDHQTKMIFVYSIVCYSIGIICYSTFFVFSENHSYSDQIFKIAISACHLLFLVAPMAFSSVKNRIIAIVSKTFVIISVCYLVFLISFFKYFNFLPNIFSYSPESVLDFREVLGHYFRQVFGLVEILLFLSLICFVQISKRVKTQNQNYTLVNGFLLLLISTIIPLTLFFISTTVHGPVSRSVKYGELVVIRRFGPLIHLMDNYKQQHIISRNSFLEKPVPFPGKLANLSKGGRKPRIQIGNINDVYLFQIESLDPHVIDATVNGNYVMPFLRELKNSCCVSYSNFYTVRSAGGSSDSEFSVITGLVPSRKRQSLRYADATKTNNIFEMLSGLGVKSYFSHNNEFGFYGRNRFYLHLKHVNLNFLKNRYESEFDFARRTMSEAVNDSVKSFYYFFNFMSHGPYKGYQKYKNRLGHKPDNMKSIDYDYYRSLSQVDQMLKELYDLQKTFFEIGSNVIIVTSDHPSGLFRSGHTLEERLRIPLLICNSGLTAGIRPDASSHIDLHSTISSLFNGSNEGLGTDLLSGKQSVALLRNGRYIVYKDKKLSVHKCEGQCESYFKYTDQFIRH